MSDTDTHTQMERTTNLLISSNVHYVHLGGDKNSRTVKNFLTKKSSKEKVDRIDSKSYRVQPTTWPTLMCFFQRSIFQRYSRLSL